MKDRKVLFTAFAIFLLMGAAPLHAARVHGAEEAVQQQAIGNQASASLALQEKFGPFGTSCESLQENFLRLNSEASGSLTALQNGEELSFTAKVALAMKVRGMLRAARRAASNECSWLGDSNVVNFQERVQELAAMSPCADTAREMIEAGNDLDEEAQEEVVREALQVFMSPTCELPEDDEDDDDADEADSDGEETCAVGDTVACPNDANVVCAGNQCCPDGSACPSASNEFSGCASSKASDCTHDLSEASEENTQEEDEMLEEIDELADELTAAALADPSGASFLQENEGQDIVAAAFIAIFFGLFFLLWLPFVVGAACFATGMGFLVFSLIGCMLFNLMRLLMGRVPGGCPMFNWLPHCPQLFAVTVRGIWGNNVRVGGYNSAYYGGGYNQGYNTGYGGVGYNTYGPGYVAPVTTGVYYDRRRRFWSGGAARRHNRQVRRANRRANRRSNRRARRANRRARRARRMGRRR